MMQMGHNRSLAQVFGINNTYDSFTLISSTNFISAVKNLIQKSKLKDKPKDNDEQQDIIRFYN